MVSNTTRIQPPCLHSMPRTNASVLTLHPAQCPFHHTLPHTMPLPLHHAPYNAPSFTQSPTQCPCPHTLPHTMPLPSYHVPHSAPAFSLCLHKTLFLSSLSFSLSKHPKQHCLLKWFQAHSFYGVSTGEFGFSPAYAPRPASS